MTQRVGIVASYKSDGSPWPLKARSKDYFLEDVRELLRMAEDNGEDKISLTISEDGLLGAVFEDGEYELAEPLPGDYRLGITAADIKG